MKNKQWIFLLSFTVLVGLLTSCNSSNKPSQEDNTPGVSEQDSYNQPIQLTDFA